MVKIATSIRILHKCKLLVCRAYAVSGVVFLMFDEQFVEKGCGSGSH
jgi:hypothetical protein